MSGMVAAPNRIKELREAQKLTLDEVAERAGTSAQNISRLERGTRRLTEEWIRIVARGLDVDPSVILGDVTPDKRVFAHSEEEAHLLTQWRLMPFEDRIYLAETIRRLGIARHARTR